MTHYDYAVIAFYFLFMLLMGGLASRFIKNSSDYFRGGGQMMWWLVGAAAFMTQFSAWTFTGAASKAYSEGWPILVIFFANAVGFIANAAYFAPRARQMRVITAIEAVRQRFSQANEHVFTWLQIPLGTLYAGIWLNGLCVFLSAAFGFNLEHTILLTGLVVVAMTLLGGSWAAIAGDFIQMLVLMPVTVVAAFLALREVGGVQAFIERLPAGHLDIAAAFDSPLMLVWVVAILVKQFISTNNMLEGSRYLCVKDDVHARRAALLAAALFLVGPIIWFIPPMAASILHPDLGAVFPSLKNPSEGAFLAISVTTMPAGMIGLLLCGILAATMSSMDSGLNKNAGFFVKNFYHTVVRPHATEKELVTAGKCATAVLGILVIIAAINFSRMEDIGLFDLMLQFGTLIAVPYTIPLVLCVFIKRTPSWSGWSTVIVCLVASLLTTRYLDARWLESVLQLVQPLTNSEAGYWTIAVGLFVNVLVGVAWFVGTMAFWKATPSAERDRIEAFYSRMLTPVDFAREEGANSDHAQARLLGNLSLAYGGFISLLALIPNPMAGRLGFVFCGVVVVAVGVALKHSARKR
ncbi:MULTISPECIES: transporter [unclassified Roseateles]|uniref:sodium:solute symporter family transporter n=1 Tax=unclassified Roseateles TaxID=2626991 RepID=UPI0006FDE187|nr:MULTISPECIES: transporter [unclassified Roseateles]KQW52158.1 transporter [Pelomonas sp. Root405]KRA78392.1 transporter [Pelomonas sp. Root662]